MNKTTEELLCMLQKSKNVVQLIKENDNEFRKLTFIEYLEHFLNQYGVNKSEVINKSKLNQIYAYQIFAGTKKPSRDKIIALMFGYPLSVSDGNLLLISAKMSALSVRNKKDAIIIFGLTNKLNIYEIDDLLFELGEETINK